MSEKKSGWTRPGAIDAEEARKGTAAAHPVLVVAPDGAAVAGTPTENGHRPPQQEPAEPRDTRSPAEIEADLGRTRERLSETLNELSERLSPRGLARQGGRQVKARFVDEQTGRLRADRALAVLGGLGGAIGVLAVLRRARGRSS